MGRKAGRKFVTANVRARRKLAAIAIGDQVVAPGDQLALRIQAGLQADEATGAVGVVGRVVFPRPQAT